MRPGRVKVRQFLARLVRHIHVVVEVEVISHCRAKLLFSAMVANPNPYWMFLARESDGRCACWMTGASARKTTEERLVWRPVLAFACRWAARRKCVSGGRDGGLWPVVKPCWVARFFVTTRLGFPAALRNFELCLVFD